MQLLPTLQPPIPLVNMILSSFNRHLYRCQLLTLKLHQHRQLLHHGHALTHTLYSNNNYLL